MMNLLHVVHFPIYGGPHNQALRLDAALRQRGWHTKVLLPDEPGNAADRLRAGGVEVITMPLGRLRATKSVNTQARFFRSALGDVKRIRQLIKAEAIDLVLIGGLVNPHAAIAARLEGVPVVWQIVDSRTPKPLRAAMMPVLNRLADATMFDGAALIDLHDPKRRLKPPTFVYYPPVDIEVFDASASEKPAIRAELGFSDADLVVGMVANVNPQKGIEYFVESADLIRKEVPTARFLLVGAFYDTHRTYTDRILGDVASRGLDMVMTGYRDDVERMYHAMDVKLITSVPRSEGTTTTAMEAAACQVPVVATNVGAVLEVVEDGVTGFVVPALDSPAISNATVRLLQDESLRRRMGQAGRARAENLYSVQVCADTHVRAFEAALRHAASRQARTSAAAA
jgi:glycosyltransferase involved in cell wall biosynthesis